MNANVSVPIQRRYAMSGPKSGGSLNKGWLVATGVLVVIGIVLLMNVGGSSREDGGVRDRSTRSALMRVGCAVANEARLNVAVLPTPPSGFPGLLVARALSHCNHF